MRLSLLSGLSFAAGVAFAPLAHADLTLGVITPLPGSVAAFARFTLMLVFIALYGMGKLLVEPAHQNVVAEAAPGSLLGVYYGFASFFSQIGRKGADDPREIVVFNSGGGEVTHPVTKQQNDNAHLQDAWLGESSAVLAEDAFTPPTRVYTQEQASSGTWCGDKCSSTGKTNVTVIDPPPDHHELLPRPRPAIYWPDDILELAEALLQAE